MTIQLLILKEQTTLVKTRQRVTYTDARGKERAQTYLMIGPASDGTWTFKTLQASTWTDVDTKELCYNYYYQEPRTLNELERRAYEQHRAQLRQKELF
jgi:hypothetical protein